MTDTTPRSTMAPIALPQQPQVMQVGEPLELTVSQVAARMGKLKEIIDKLLVPGLHYGVIPGTTTKSLLQAGAEVLAVAFRLAPIYAIESLDSEEMKYTVRCDLHHQVTGRIISSGLGLCSAGESKYRYRYVASNETPGKEEAERMKAEGLGRWRKNKEGKWSWQIRIENPDPVDQENTILQMAQKRAFVRGIRNGTGASAFGFTQDVEDFTESDDSQVTHEVQDQADSLRKVHQQSQPTGSWPGDDMMGEPQDPPQIKKPGEPASEKQVKAIYAMAHKAGIDDAVLLDTLQKDFGVNSMEALTKGKASDVIGWLQGEQPKQGV